MSSTKIWLITGASSGLGQALADAVLAKGDKVVATGRDLSRLESLRSSGASTVRLDHNEPLDLVTVAIAKAVAVNGRIDIVVNNAAYVQTGMLEETTPEETLTQFQANVFGPLNVYRAILPYLRQQRSGILATIGSMAAWYPMAGCNLYNASKAAMHLISVGLKSETAQFGIQHCLIEPGFFRTALLDPKANIKQTTSGRTISDYEEGNRICDENFVRFNGKQLGDPVKGAAVIYDVITSSGTAEGKGIPSTLALGSDAVTEITKSAQATIDEINEWAAISCLSDFTNS